MLMLFEPSTFLHVQRNCSAQPKSTLRDETQRNAKNFQTTKSLCEFVIVEHKQNDSFRTGNSHIDSIECNVI